MSNKEYEPVIGLEIHVQLATQSKMFCGCPADWFGKPANSLTCPVCLGLPGALPVANERAIEWTIKVAMALQCKIASVSKFDRKHYFYPDLAKGYQISQHDQPLGSNGSITLQLPGSGDTKTVQIRRVHLEEDTGKLIHKGADTLADFNRSGVPLVEIVTEPDFHTSDEVKVYLEELQTIVRYLGVSDGDMEKGSMRLEPNISLRKKGETDLPKYKVEVKNINSFRFAKRAIDYEIARHAQLLNKGEVPQQETRGWNEGKNITVSQRVKEEAHDYRYFPEPDIPPLSISQEYMRNIRGSLPELPADCLERFMSKYDIRYDDAFTLTRDLARSDVADYCLSRRGEVPAQFIANEFINNSAHDPAKGKQVILENITKAYRHKLDLSNTSVPSEVIQKVVDDNEKAVQEYRSGKETVIMFLVGQVMKEMKGQADASAVRKNLEEELKK